MQNSLFDGSSRLSVSAALLTLIACYMFAVRVDAGDASSRPTVPEVRQLLRANGTEDVGAMIGPIVAQQVIGILRARGEALSPSQQSAIAKSVITYITRQAKRDHLSDRFVPIYQKYFSSTEVSELSSFYTSPLGRKLIRTTPAISFATAEIGQEWARSVLPGLQSTIASQLRGIGTHTESGPSVPAPVN